MNNNSKTLSDKELRIRQLSIKVKNDYLVRTFQMNFNDSQNIKALSLKDVHAFITQLIESGNTETKIQQSYYDVIAQFVNFENSTNDEFKYFQYLDAAAKCVDSALLFYSYDISQILKKPYRTMKEKIEEELVKANSEFIVEMNKLDRANYFKEKFFVEDTVEAEDTEVEVTVWEGHEKGNISSSFPAYYNSYTRVLLIDDIKFIEFIRKGNFAINGIPVEGKDLKYFTIRTKFVQKLNDDWMKEKEVPFKEVIQVVLMTGNGYTTARPEAVSNEEEYKAVQETFFIKFRNDCYSEQRAKGYCYVTLHYLDNENNYFSIDVSSSDINLRNIIKYKSLF